MAAFTSGVTPALNPNRPGLPKFAVSPRLSVHSARAEDEGIASLPGVQARSPSNSWNPTGRR